MMKLMTTSSAGGDPTSQSALGLPSGGVDADEAGGGPRGFGGRLARPRPPLGRRRLLLLVVVLANEVALRAAAWMVLGEDLTAAAPHTTGGDGPVGHGVGGVRGEWHPMPLAAPPLPRQVRGGDEDDVAVLRGARYEACAHVRVLGGACVGVLTHPGSCCHRCVCVERMNQVVRGLLGFLSGHRVCGGAGQRMPVREDMIGGCGVLEWRVAEVMERKDTMRGWCAGSERVHEILVLGWAALTEDWCCCCIAMNAPAPAVLYTSAAAAPARVRLQTCAKRKPQHL